MFFYILSACCLVVGILILWLVGVFFVVNYSQKPTAIRRAASKVAGPKRRPLVGNLGQIPRKQEKYVDFLVQTGLEFNGMFCLMFGPQPLVIVTKGDIAAQILKSSKHSEKSFLYSMLHPWLGTGLLTSNGQKWRQRRKMITPAFHFDILDRSFESMMKHTKVAMEILESKAEQGKFIDIWKAVSLLALEIIADTAMGVDLGAQKRNSESLEYVENRAAVMQLIAERIRVPLLWNDFVYSKLTQRGRRHEYLVKRLHKFTTDVMKRRWTEMQEMTNDERNKEAEESSDRRKKNSFLDLLLTAKQEHGLTFEDIREEVDTFMFEGHDTTTASISCVLQALCNNPHVLAKLQCEVDATLDRFDNDQQNYKDFKNALLSMPYLDAVIKEGLRLYPVAPNFGRHLTEDDEINGYKLLKGTAVMVQAFAIHRDPEIYREPYKFDPERWIRKEVPVEENPYCYIPFSAGPRNCIGQKFALLEEKLVIASIVKNFDMISDTEAKDFAVFGQLVIQPVKKFHIKFNVRAQTFSAL